MRRRLFIIFAVLTLAVSKAGAQYDVAFSHYWDLEPYFNAGAVGKQQKLNVAAAYALSFAGFENNPRSMYVGADMPLYFLKTIMG